MNETTDLVVPQIERQLTAVSQLDNPEEVIAFAIRCARSLRPVIEAADKRLTLGGKEYLFFESWQTLGWFFGVNAQVCDVEAMEAPDGRFLGFHVTAEGVRGGQVICRAEAECSTDEANWKNKPRFQLLSMAQTRAQAKVLRTCLAWVAVLGGYAPTAAEEMEDAERPQPAKRGKSGAKAAPHEESVTPEPEQAHSAVSEGQHGHSDIPGSAADQQRARIIKTMETDDGKARVQKIVKCYGWQVSGTAQLSAYQAAIIIALLDGRDPNTIERQGEEVTHGEA